MPVHRISRNAVLSSLAIVLFTGWLVVPTEAVPLRPDVLERVRAEGRLPEIVAATERAARDGLDQPPATARRWLTDLTGDRTIPDRNAIVILVDFSDNVADQATYPPSHYDEMLFSEATYPTGSMRDWYLENSYGAFHVTGAVTIWLRMPETYAYYVNGQAGLGNYPRNAQKLTEDAVVAADPYVDFSQFDNDGPDGIPDSGDDDGYVDALFVVHAGPGREETGSNNDIHSHAWVVQNPVAVDGVTAYSYSMEPENGKIGVFGHEFGHVLGLPDLYDTDYSSSGVGSWCMMSFGSWGNGGLTPTHFLSWCKAQLGFLDPVEPLTNENGVSIPRVEFTPKAYALWTGGYPEAQYFLVENRQRVGFDAYLPGGGLVICHIDQNVSGNQNEEHPLVAVEQADGLNELAQGGASDNGDPWPGSTNNRNFTDTSNPNTRDYDGNPTQVAVRNISDSGATMTADVEVENAPILVIENYVIDEVTGNGDGDIDPGEQFDLPVTLYNRGSVASNVTATLSSTDPDLVIDTAVSDYGTIAAEATGDGTPPFRATLAGGSTSDAIPFDLEIQEGLRAVTNLSFVVGINDPLEVFRWTHGNVTPGYGDQWHVTTYRNHTLGGSYAWKCGGQGAAHYADLVDAALTTRSLPLATVDALLFWHWIDAEDDVNNTAWDGGILEASVDGGAWEQITPDGGYPYTIIANPASPFPGGTPCFSGTYDWSQVRVDLTGLVGTEVRIRFRFGSDGFVTGEGWYLDDVSIEGTIPSGVVETASSGATLLLSPPLPNPAAGAVTLRFVQPAGVTARLSLVDVGGRRLIAWQYPEPAAGAGAARELRWDGRLRDGRLPAGGVYFLRLDAGAARQTQRLLWLR